MRCRLCLEEKTLLKKSHVIPNFMYRELFDEEHNIYKIDLGDWKEQQVQTGEFEADILCANCDNNLLGGLEDYASKVLYGGRIGGIFLENQRNQHSVEFTYCKGIDYKKFKLFLLSTIWKCSISTRAYYKQIDLGPYEEKVRKMLFEGTPGKQTDYPCVISSYRKHKELPHQVIGQPIRFKHGGGGIGYSILIGGMTYIYFISAQFMNPVVLEAAINESGEMRIIHMPKEQGAKMLQKYLGHEFRQGG